jgi:hypothetical protein
MTRALVHRLVRDVVRAEARGRPVRAGTEFSRIGIGPWQRQRFFGPVRSALLRRAVDIGAAGVTRESFMDFRRLLDVQAAVWRACRHANKVSK